MGNRPELQLEIISYYVFRVLWIPMTITLFIPAFLSLIVNYMRDFTKESHKISSNEPDKVHMNISTDEEYKKQVQKEIHKVMNDDFDQMSEDIKNLAAKFRTIEKNQEKYA